jgi:nitrate/nitrite transport system ATP-binding protein
VTIDIPRPRDRKAMNHDERFKNARNQVIEYLLGPGRRRSAPPRRNCSTRHRDGGGMNRLDERFLEFSQSDKTTPPRPEAVIVRDFDLRIRKASSSA